MAGRSVGPRALPHRTTLQRLNAELALASLELGEGHVAHRPLHVALQVSSGCNLDCYMCLEHTRPKEEKHGRGLKTLSREVFDVVERDLFPYSSRMTFAIGGEPTLAEHIEHFLERAFLCGQEVELLTNGTRLDHGNLAEVVARCVGYLQISIDGATKATYERIRGGASLARVTANIELFNRHRAAHPKDERTHLSFWVTLMRSNVHELPLLVELAKRLDVDRVHAHHVSPATPEAAADSLVGHEVLWNECRARAIETAARLGVELDVPAPSPTPNGAHAAPAAESPAPAPIQSDSAEVAPIAAVAHAEPAREPEPAPDLRAAAREKDPRYARASGLAVPCHLPGTSIYILWDGRVVPCCYTFALDKLTMGHLPAQSVEALWNGRLYRNLRAGMASGDVLSVCRHCPVVHDVPVTAVEEAEMRASPTLAEWFEGRDLPGAEARESAVDVLARLQGSRTVAELDDLRRHARALEEERPHLKGHIVTLEGERPHLLGHIANLERELANLRQKNGG